MFYTPPKEVNIALASFNKLIDKNFKYSYDRPKKVQVVALVTFALISLLSLINLGLVWAVVIDIHCKCQMSLRAAKAKLVAASAVLQARKIPDDTMKKLGGICNFDTGDNEQELEGFLASVMEKFEKK